MGMNKSRLHLPAVPARPGEKPDFSYVALSPAGAVPKPEVGARARDLLALSTELVRVLDEHGQAQGPWNPRLEPEDLQVGLRHMMLTRIYDDRMQRTQRAGRISFYMRSPSGLMPLRAFATSIAAIAPTARSSQSRGPRPALSSVCISLIAPR